MARFPTFPTLYNEVIKLYVSKLKQWGYLEPESFKSGTVNWYRNGEKFSTISILANADYIIVRYTCNGIDKQYQINIEYLPSNLGKGQIPFFICPFTGKRCRTLYLLNGNFSHRSACKGCFYESQTQSKYSRKLEKLFKHYFDSGKYYEEIYSKHFKSHYNGKPTKRYLKLLEKIEKAEQVTPEMFERAAVGLM